MTTLWPTIVLVAIDLIQLSGADGRVITVNVDQLVSIREIRPNDVQLIVSKFKCVLTMTDGKFIGVQETCDEVRDRLKDIKR